MTQPPRTVNHAWFGEPDEHTIVGDAGWMHDPAQVHARWTAVTEEIVALRAALATYQSTALPLIAPPDAELIDAMTADLTSVTVDMPAVDMPGPALPTGHENDAERAIDDPTANPAEASESID